VKRALVGGAALALAVGGMGLAQAQQPDGYKVNGGGQVILDERAPGAGDTVASTAQQLVGNDGTSSPVGSSSTCSATGARPTSTAP
jgi:hypothetical protein